MNKLKLGLLICLLALGFIVRLYKFNGPVADWHSWRQADTSSVSRNFVSGGFDLLHPRFDDLSNVPSGIYDNPQGYRFVEFPIYNVFQAGLFITLGHLTIEEWGRLVTIFCSLFSAVFLYLIVKRRQSWLAGILATAFFVFLPFNIYYSRTILPDPLMVTFILGAIYCFDLWLNISITNKVLSIKYLILFGLTLIFSAGAFLIKPFAAFFMLPMLYLAFEKYGLNLVKKWQLWLLAILAILPFGAWRIWMQQYPAGIPQSWWLLNGSNIRFHPSFFRWIFYERLTKLILGYSGIIIFIAAFIKKYKSRDLLFVLSFALASLVYVCVVATGNVQHDYYQILVIPSIALILALGSINIIKFFEKYHKFLGVGIVFILVIVGFYFAWNQIKDFYNIDNPSIIAAGQAVDKLTPKNAKVIANYNGDTSFLYQTKRKGWASFEKGLPQMVQMGASYLALVNPTPADIHLGTMYKIIAQTPQYIIFDLRQKL